jgi:hypothetical protein
MIRIVCVRYHPRLPNGPDLLIHDHRILTLNLNLNLICMNLCRNYQVHFRVVEVVKGVDDGKVLLLYAAVARQGKRQLLPQRRDVTQPHMPYRPLYQTPQNAYTYSHR